MRDSKETSDNALGHHGQESSAEEKTGESRE